MMHAQAESEKESEDKDDGNNAGQALRRSNKRSRENGITFNHNEKEPTQQW
jgi:hypothetical protein